MDQTKQYINNVLLSFTVNRLFLHSTQLNQDTK